MSRPKEMCWRDSRTILPHRGCTIRRSERDACGVGFVANIEHTGNKSMESRSDIPNPHQSPHRGACGCDPKPATAPGVLIQIPHAFFDRECRALGFTLPVPGEYGIGMVFLPVAPQERVLCEGIIEKNCR